jgi:hypothetical protein
MGFVSYHYGQKPSRFLKQLCRVGNRVYLFLEDVKFCQGVGQDPQCVSFVKSFVPITVDSTQIILIFNSTLSPMPLLPILVLDIHFPSHSLYLAMNGSTVLENET